MSNVATIWQVSGGPGNRTYADVFLRHGVVLIGPGDPGPWDPTRYVNVSKSDRKPIERFAIQMHSGDVVLLRMGQSRIRAIGIVVGEYEHLEAFDDVNGWDLQHTRRVRWSPLPSEHDFGLPVFGANPRRVSQVRAAEVVDYAKRFVASPPTNWQMAALPALPAEEPALAEVPTDLQILVAEAKDLHGLWWDRRQIWEHPAEDEPLAHLVVPLLRALGWRSEQIAVKWRYIDLSLFTALPRSPENCRLVIEVKRLGAGVEGALEQAKSYVKALGRPCDVMVTDGIRYRLYDGRRDYAPLAYANLVRLKASSMELFNRIRRV